MKVLDLFSGIGGFSLGLERAGMETVAFCEIEEFPRKVLKKHWPDVSCYTDIRELTGERLKQDGITAELICGGYPCQPFSVAGKRAGKEDDRHLWPEYLRLIREIRPRWVIGENVAGHITMGLDGVLSDLEAEGYTWETFIIPACAVDAPHRRDRVWIVANRQSERGHGSDEGVMRQEQRKPGGMGGRSIMAYSEKLQRNGCGEYTESRERQISEPGNQGGAENVANSNVPRREQQRGDKPAQQEHTTAKCGSRWQPEPSVGRVAHGIPSRVDRLKGLGNAVVPQIPEIIGRAIMEHESTITTGG